MVRCKSCGHMNSEEDRFCSSCGSALPVSNNQVMKDKIIKAQKSFDKDSLVNLELSRITYICTVCGSINSIEQDRCRVCGKPRPRSEYIASLRKLKQSKKMRQEIVEEEPIIQEPIEEEIIQEPIKEVAPVEESKEVVGVGASGGQMSAAVQPVVIVPYINTQQPLWQYSPNQVYRFEPYSQEEIEEMARARMENEMRQKEMLDVEQEEKLVICEEKERDSLKGNLKRTKIISLISLLISFALLACIFLVDYTKAGDTDPAIRFVCAIINCLEEVGLNLGLDTVHYPYVYLGWYSFVPPILLILLIFLLIGVIIKSLITLIFKETKRKGIFLTLLVFLCAAGTLIGIVNQTQLELTTESLKAYFKSAGAGTYVIVGLALLLFIVSLFNKRTVIGKKEKKNVEKCIKQ